MLDDTQDAAGGTPEAAIDPCWRSNMLIQVLLRGGQASPTHTFVYLDRYGGRVHICAPAGTTRTQGKGSPRAYVKR